MGSTSWHDNILQALLIGLVVQIVVSVLWVFCDGLWASWKERMARPPTGESMAESDVEMGTVNVGEGVAIRDNPLHGLAANSGVKDDGKPLEDTENTTETSMTSTPEIPHLSKAQGKNVTEDVKRRASMPVVVDVSHPQQVGELSRCWPERKPNLQSVLQHLAVFRMLSTLVTLSNLSKSAHPS